MTKVGIASAEVTLSLELQGFFTKLCVVLNKAVLSMIFQIAEDFFMIM